MLLCRPGYAPTSSDEEEEDEDEFVQDQREPVDILMDRRLKEVLICFFCYNEVIVLLRNSTWCLVNNYIPLRNGS